MKRYSREERIRKVKKEKRILLVLLILAVAVIAAAVFNRWKVKIEVNGKNPLSVEAGKEYRDPGAKAYRYGTILRFDRKPVSVKVSGEPDMKKPGSYTVKYSAEWNGHAAEDSRDVLVQDTTPPKIKLKKVPGSYTVPGHAYQEEGYTATDAVDGDLTAKVQHTEKDGKVYYSVQDSAGNTGKAVRSIHYDDKTPPVITLNGGNQINVPMGAPYQDSFTAKDDADGDVTSKVTVTGSVDTSKEGTYTLQYSVKDSHGNKSEAKRTVVVRKVMSEEEGDKLVYLTFDDGPGPYTERLLGILAKYKVKATFFVTHAFPKYEDMLQKEAEAGHAVAVHTYSHDYKKIYSSTQAYWDDFNQMNEVIRKQTGKSSSIFRFPGGSSNTVSRKYCPGIMTKLTQEAGQKGLAYFDWNVLSGDAGDTRDSKKITQNIIQGIQKHHTSVVLCHDIHDFTVNAMDETLSWATKNGYRFEVLSSSSFPAHQTVNN